MGAENGAPLPVGQLRGVDRDDGVEAQGEGAAHEAGEGPGPEVVDEAAGHAEHDPEADEGAVGEFSAESVAEKAARQHAEEIPGEEDHLDDARNELAVAHQIPPLRNRVLWYIETLQRCLDLTDRLGPGKIVVKPINVLYFK